MENTKENQYQTRPKALSFPGPHRETGCMGAQKDEMWQCEVGSGDRVGTCGARRKADKRPLTRSLTPVVSGASTAYYCAMKTCHVLTMRRRQGMGVESCVALRCLLLSKQSLRTTVLQLNKRRLNLFSIFNFQ
jgi:hypothetical protein